MVRQSCIRWAQVVAVSMGYVTYNDTDVLSISEYSRLNEEVMVPGVGDLEVTVRKRNASRSIHGIMFRIFMQVLA